MLKTSLLLLLFGVNAAIGADEAVIGTEEAGAAVSFVARIKSLFLIMVHTTNYFNISSNILHLILFFLHQEVARLWKQSQ
jgi:hypothetical protein